MRRRLFARRRAHAVALLAASLLLVGGCGDDETTDPGPTDEMTVSFSGLGPGSPASGHYELWVSFALLRGSGLRHSEAATAGKFRIDAAGVPVGLSGAPINFAVSPDDPHAQAQDGKVLWQLALDAFVTVEPEGDTDGEPSLPGILAGSFLNGSCALGVNEADAIHVDFTGVAGSFHLATPTTGPTSDENEGVWFAEPGGAAASLQVPTLPVSTGWTYEAWVQHPSAGTASLGKFRNAAGADLDGPGPLGGTGYAFPGSDFPFGRSGEDLSGSTVFVTLEPPQDADGAGPFFLRLLAAPAGGFGVGGAVNLAALPGGLPGGQVRIPISE